MMLGRTIEARWWLPRLGVRPALDDPLAHRLGERVAVGPAQAAGPLGADPDQLVLDPLLARRLGGAGGGEQAGPAVLLLRLLPLLDQYVDAARAVLDLLALRQPPGQLGVEVDVVLDRRLGDAAPAPARDVGRRDVHVVDVAARLAACASSMRSSRSRVPMTLVVNPSSTGGSKETSPAQCTTASRSVGSSGTSARSPSTTVIRSASTCSTPPGRLDVRRRRSASRAAWPPVPCRAWTPWAGPAPTSARRAPR